MHCKAQELVDKEKEFPNGNACSSSVFNLAEVHGPEMWFVNMDSSSDARCSLPAMLQWHI